MTTEKKVRDKNKFVDWIVRLLKGILVGVGFITPGLSGGVLAVVFGIYEPLLRFLGNIKEKIGKNILFFLPVGIGGVIGMVAFSAVVDFAFSNYAAQFTWLFIGFIAGTMPSLFKTSGKQGRKTGHWLVLVLTAAATVFLMRWTENMHTVQLKPSFWSWLLSGGLIALGVVVPGMSPSNFLIYLGLYQPMASGIRHFDLGVMVPLLLGGIVVVLLFARLVSWLFKKYYAFMYHFILGIVVGSTLIIIPGGVGGWTIAVCVILFIAGAVSSYFLAKLDEKHPREDLFA